MVLFSNNNFRAWKYRISLVLEENELDSCINEEVPVLEGDEATQEEVGYGKEDDYWFYQGSPHTTGVLPQET